MKKTFYFKITIISPLIISWLGNFLHFPFLDCISSFLKKLELVWGEANAGPESHFLPSPAFLSMTSKSAQKPALATKSQPCPFTAKMAFVQKTTSQEKYK